MRRRPTLGPTGSTRAWRQIRAAAVARDAYRCTACGGYGGGAPLEVHHITPRTAWENDPPPPGDPDELGNLETLCRRCHRQHHAAAGGRFFVGDRGADRGLAALSPRKTSDSGPPNENDSQPLEELGYGPVIRR